MPSLSSNPARPAPQQERSARTHALFLDTAETLFVEVGYDAATMTAIAERANASIGALYRWFPDKAALGTALMARYSQEIEEHWAPVFAAANALQQRSSLRMMIETTMEFVRQKPAYFVLREAPIKRSRGPAARQESPRGIREGIPVQKPALSHDRAYLIANVVLDTIKGFLAGAASSTFKGAAGIDHGIHEDVIALPSNIF